MSAYDTTTLLGAYGAMDPFDPFLLNLLFPDVIMFDTEEVAFDKVVEDQTLAPFVSPLVAGKPRRERGGEVRSFVPACLKPKDVVHPGRALKRRPGEGIGGQLSAEQRMNAIRFELLGEQRQQIKRRQEWMVAEFLRTGKIIVTGEDYPTAEVDYGRDPNFTVTLAAGAKWGSGTDDPVDDLEGWMQELDAPATHVIFGRKALRNAMLSEKFKDLVETRRGSDTTLEMAPTANLAAYRGRFGGAGPELWSYTGWYRDAQGAKQLFVPDNGVVLVSQGINGARCYGAILDKKAGFRGMELFPKNWENDDPAVEYIMTQSRPLPVPRLPNASLYATVCD